MDTHSTSIMQLDAAVGELGLAYPGRTTGAPDRPPGSPLPTLRCNLTAMTQVFQNLVGNAFEVPA